MKRHHRLFDVILQPAARFPEHVLHHVARVHAAGDGAVHPHVDHLPKRFAVPVHQIVDGRGIAFLGFAEQFLRFLRIRPHGIC